jgi:hypothetical protein
MSLPPESGSHNEMHNLVCGRISDEKDKVAVYAGILSLKLSGCWVQVKVLLRKFRRNFRKFRTSILFI